MAVVLHRGACAGFIATILVAAPLPAPRFDRALAQDPIAELLSKLDDRQQEELAAYRKARARFEAEASAYWDRVNEKRSERRRKKRAGEALTPDDYVIGLPPEYVGPKLSKAVADALAEQEKKEPAAPRPVFTLDDFLENAKTRYGFEPDRISEPDFKRRYAREALDVGLTPDQVVRVYALETGGQGTADMQSGINPITKKGTPISSALGYAQLLHANSVNEIVKHGPAFAARLDRMAAQPGLTAKRVAALRAKQRILRKMIARARSVPNEWSHHMRFAATPDGLGIHALNLDGDIGPWLQVAKLNDIRKLAADNGRATLTGAELELMNLAGPATGLEMMTPLGRAAPTPNFFSRGGYDRNPVVRGRTGADLLDELGRRMEVSLKRPGAVEFIGIFAELDKRRVAQP